MAIGTPVVVGTGTATATSSTIVCTLSAGVSAGDKAFCVAGGRANGATLTSVTDARGNTYAVDASATQIDGNNHVGIAEAQVAVALLAGDAVTATFTGGPPGPSIEIIVFKVSGLVSGNSLDQSATASTDLSITSTINGATTSTTTQADEIVFGTVIFGAATVGRAVAAGYTELQYLSSTGAASGDRPIWVEYKIVSATGAQTSGGTETSGANNAACITTTHKAAAPTAFAPRRSSVRRA